MSQGSHQMSEEELAQFQKASNEYEAPVTGPLVGQRQPSTAITTEYASADPVYQAKTQSLPQKYSYYRTVRGDGKCGWRAVAFGYFEALIHHGDGNRFGMEEARLRSLGNVVLQSGYSQMVYEDFADTTYELLRELANAVNENVDAVALLLERFNEDIVQDYIISHLRALTAAWMITRDADYAPWLLGQTVEQYCKDQILPVAAEIEHVGLSALKDAFLAPAAISLEVLYLDRSEGDQVTMHRFDPVTNGGYTLGTVRLLYRPGHYDLLYKPEDLPAPPPPPAPVPTYLQFGTQTHQEPAYDLGVSAMPDFLMTIPGMSYASQPPQAWGMPSSYSTDFTFSAPAPVSACTPAVQTPSAPAPQPQSLPSQPVYVSGSSPTQLVPPPTQLTHEMAIRPAAMAQAHLGHHDLQSQLGGGPFRMSAYNYEADFMQATSQMPFQTSIFRNSHFNQAHFLNPDFQPEQWDPEGEYTTASSSKSSRHKNCG
ncbi:uncharacterized protein MYCFIDRAFT_162177 [Pseudocercospora fijiensis CIRAD86]|uniref:ubiquitinyl hydrolase 1 n=1 Tax=Pseudocercospora fijiensis (strain CIRAD86) TaxID=383855 RepID=M3BBB6_PSEFD|nr:uncharacterized protein MYCFIDRAFT_162177 [Pseudocercospora fijiensis CIRAD86]EME86592.1 hypothetical protein MYCFIDRAFT_162177 [Pseudocercospora fijiensis CIRAD86]